MKLRVRSATLPLLAIATLCACAFYFSVYSAPHILHGMSATEILIQEQRHEFTDELKNASFATPKTSPLGRRLYREEDLVPVAMDIFRKRGLVLFTFINDAYLEFAVSWLCNTEPMADIHQHVLFVVTDLRSADRLQKAWPDINVVALNASRYSGNQTYSRAGYVRIMIERTRYLHRLLQSGVRLLLFEVDCVWLSNPLPLLLDQQTLEAVVEADIVATRVGSRTAGGFLLLSPTQRTLRLWGELTRLMDRLYEQLKNQLDSAFISWELNDQEFLAALIKERFGGIEVFHLPVELFPDGNWYSKPAKERKAEPLPVIINNNFIAGNAAKKKRAKAFGHWFLKSASDLSLASCNTTAVHAVLHP